VLTVAVVTLSFNLKGTQLRPRHTCHGLSGYHRHARADARIRSIRDQVWQVWWDGFH